MGVYPESAMLSQTTHATLLARVAGGTDPTAWLEFCERYEALIRGFARRHGMQPADGDEVLQDVLLALTRSMPEFEYDPARGKFRSYLKTVALHAMARRIRQNPVDVQLGEDEGVERAGAAEPETEAAWETEWRQYHLRLAMPTIAVEFNEPDRAAFEAYAVEGQDARETAERLGLTVDQVYQAKSRILKRLSQLIDAQVREEG